MAELLAVAGGALGGGGSEGGRERMTYYVIYTISCFGIS